MVQPLKRVDPENSVIPIPKGVFFKAIFKNGKLRRILLSKSPVFTQNLKFTVAAKHLIAYFPISYTYLKKVNGVTIYQIYIGVITYKSSVKVDFENLYNSLLVSNKSNKKAYIFIAFAAYSKYVYPGLKPSSYLLHSVKEMFYMIHSVGIPSVLQLRKYNQNNQNKFAVYEQLNGGYKFNSINIRIENVKTTVDYFKDNRVKIFKLTGYLLAGLLVFNNKKTPKLVNF